MRRSGREKKRRSEWKEKSMAIWSKHKCVSPNVFVRCVCRQFKQQFGVSKCVRAHGMCVSVCDCVCRQLQQLF